ncbi:Nn.00g075980.m01.CDS01 [Neocucurbitaria sp. VM-36]
MSTTAFTRRSQRTTKSRPVVQGPYRVERLTRSRTLKIVQATSRNTSPLCREVDLDALEADLSQTSSKSKVRTNVSQLIEDSASETEFSTGPEGSEEDIDDEYNELANLSGDNVAFTTADIVDRRESYDSRYESGNEEYELDDFVVGDDTDTGDGSSTDMEAEGSSDDGHSLDEDDVPVPRRVIKRRISIREQYKVEVGEKVRKASAISTRSLSSVSSGLFVTDEDDPPESLPGYPSTPPSDLTPLTPEFEHYMELPIATAALEEIMEEIMDAISLFSRRCNRKRTPLRLRLGGDALEDEEIIEALQNAMSLQMAQSSKLEDGTEVWVIRPRI